MSEATEWFKPWAKAALAAAAAVGIGLLALMVYAFHVAVGR